MVETQQAVIQTYGVERWGEGYFGINAEGHATVRPSGSQQVEIDLWRLAGELGELGLRLPVLVRFNGVLRHRVRQLCGAFDGAAQTLGFAGGYRAIYPIKVNQQRSVVEEIVAGGGSCIGLEAGSKPELMAVLAQAPAGSPIVCNGYKDREYIRLALVGQRLGHEVYIVVEKPGELDLVLDESAALGIRPLLGVRVRLASVASGKWQNSGGAKSKFGLSATQLLELVRRLSEHQALERLVMVHAHIGSQIPDLRDIHRGVGEVARLYAELHRLGAAPRIVDVGGGLGVDYEGSRSPGECSMTYGLGDYATEVLRPIVAICRERGIPEPMVFSESGRALTAHHAVLITEIIDDERPSDAPPEIAPDADELLQRLSDLLHGPASASLPRRLQTAELYLSEAQERFAQGRFDLAQRAQAEALFLAVAQRVRAEIRLQSRRHRELLDRLDDLLADRVFCNFSLFQSLPDVWAIDQIFPMMPLQRLHQAPGRVARVHDLTCDSDGCIDLYVDQDGVEGALPLHELAANERYLIGVFLVGAYQEILGDMHNLFGDTDAVNIITDADGGYRIDRPEHGDSVDELLRYVHYDPDAMLDAYGDKLRAQRLPAAQMAAHLETLREGLTGYTYFEREKSPTD
jgi:arginine decarboxylase